MDRILRVIDAAIGLGMTALGVKLLFDGTGMIHGILAIGVAALWSISCTLGDVLRAKSVSASALAQKEETE